MSRKRKYISVKVVEAVFPLSCFTCSHSFNFLCSTAAVILQKTGMWHMMWRLLDFFMWEIIFCTSSSSLILFLNPLKSTLPVQGYGGFYGELLLKLSQFLSERHRNYTPRNLEPFSFQIYTVRSEYINKHFVRRIGLVSCTF